jgi:hypothetical protein
VDFLVTVREEGHDHQMRPVPRVTRSARPWRHGCSRPRRRWADPATAEVLDAATGKIAGEGFGSIPVRDQITTLLQEKQTKPLSPERIEKEKRILLAFDAIRCSVPRGTEGGVQIGPEPGKDKKPC